MYLASLLEIGNELLRQERVALAQATDRLLESRIGTRTEHGADELEELRLTEWRNGHLRQRTLPCQRSQYAPHVGYRPVELRRAAEEHQHRQARDPCRGQRLEVEETIDVECVVDDYDPRSPRSPESRDRESCLRVCVRCAGVSNG